MRIVGWSSSKLTVKKLAAAYLEAEKHAALEAMAKRHHRTLAAECRDLFDRALGGEFAEVRADRKRKRKAKRGEEVSREIPTGGNGENRG